MFKNKESVIGWVLISVLMFAFFMYQNKKFKEEQERKKQEAKTEQVIPAVKSEKSTNTPVAGVGDTASATTGAIVDSASEVARYGVFATAAQGEEKLYTIENDVQKIVISSKGAQIKSVELKQYKTWDKKPLILFTDKTNALSYQFPVSGDKTVNTKDLFFIPEGNSFTVAGSDSNSISFRLEASNNQYIIHKYTLYGNNYQLGYTVRFINMEGVIPANTTYINAQWQNSLTSLEQNLELERRYSALYYRHKQSDVSHLDEDKEKDETSFDTPLDWISFKQQFFNTTLFSEGLIQKGKLTTSFAKDDKGYVKRYTADFILPFSTTQKTNDYNFQLYIGPNSFYGLQALNKDAEDIVKLGPNFWMFSWIKYITRFIIWVFSWFENLHLNYGIIILLMTLMLKLALHPLTSKSIESAAKMKILAPELTALREKYGDDQTKIGQEQMKIYQRAGVNPLGGCLPLLLQMPILMAMYYFFPASIELRQQPFLWAHDLSSYDAIISWATPIMGFSHISLFTILMTITSIVQAVMNNNMNAMANQQPGMKYIPYIMPVMLMFLFNSFPAALTYYYLLQNVFGVAHQWLIQKFFINEEKLRKQIEENKKNPKPKSGWQKKLEEMQRENEKRMKARK